MNKNWLEKAREHWSYKGNKRPPFAIEPKSGQRSVWDFPRPPVTENVNNPVCVSHLGTEIANSRKAKAVLETASPPTYYIPKEDVVMESLLKILNKSSFCEWKGKAEYWALEAEPQKAVAWSYAKPFKEFEDLKDHFAFYPQYLECKVDGKEVKPQPGGFYAGWITPELVGPFKGEMGTGSW